MPDMKLPNYFYGDEAMQFTYFRIPCQLITHPRFKHLSTDSKLLYGMLLDRTGSWARTNRGRSTCPGVTNCKRRWTRPTRR